MSMPIINFDDHFADYTSRWVKDHQGDYETVEEMEDDLPRVYVSFLNTPARWLKGVTPGAYFTQFEDPKVLVDWMHAYCQQNVPIPEVLLEQITAVGRPCEKRLLKLLEDENAEEEARMTAIGLLREMDSTLPKMLYITWQLNRKEKDEMRDSALESLTEMGESVVQPILQVFAQANEAGQEALLDVLTRYPGPDKIYRLAEGVFRQRKEKRALLAGYLARLGDDRALDALREAAMEPDLPYLTYIEIRNAIEALGGECPEREYAGDEDYEALQGLES